MNHIYAIVKIPIEIKPDKSYTILSERIYTTVEKCDELPPINTNQNNDIMQQIKAIVHLDPEPVVEPEPVVDPVVDPEPVVDPVVDQEPVVDLEPVVELILNNTAINSKHNMTFRNMSQMKHNITKRMKK